MRLYSSMKILFITFLIFALPVSAGVYKWTDEQGNVHYGDKPVNQKKSTEIKINTNTNTGVTNSSGDNKERDRMTKELQEDREAREKNREDKRIAEEKRRSRCKPLKAELGRHQRANNVYTLDKNGERVHYSMAEREAKMKRLKKEIAKACR